MKYTKFITKILATAAGATIITLPNANAINVDDFKVALQSGNIKRAMYLANLGDVNATDVNRSTALHIASMLGRQEIVLFLVYTRNAKVNMKDSQGFTPLHLAVDKGHKKIEKILLKALATY